LGTWVLSARSRRRARSEEASRWELRFPLAGPGNSSVHFEPNEARFDRQSIPRRRRHVGCFFDRVSRLPRGLSGIQTSRPRPVPSPDSRTGPGAGAKPTEPRAERDPRCGARPGTARSPPPADRFEPSVLAALAPGAGAALRALRAAVTCRDDWPVVSPPPAGFYDASGARSGQHSSRGPRATPRRPSSARTSTCTSVQRQWIVTW
jgi:hypothetical protein